MPSYSMGGPITFAPAAPKSASRLLAEFGGTKGYPTQLSFDTVTTALTSQSVYYVPIILEAGQLVTGHHIHVRTAAGSLTLATCALFNSALNQVAVTAESSASVNGVSNSSIYLAYSATYSVPATDVYILGQLYVGTTPPCVLKCTTNAGVADVGFKSGGQRLMGIQTSQATMPTTAVIAAANEAMFQGVY